MDTQALRFLMDASSSDMKHRNAGSLGASTWGYCINGLIQTEVDSIGGNDYYCLCPEKDHCDDCILYPSLEINNKYVEVLSK